MRHGKVTWSCCSGRERTAASGIRTPAGLRHRPVTWKCCSGREKTAASGLRRSAKKRKRTAIWRCCSGRLHTAARNDNEALIQQGGKNRDTHRRRKTLAWIRKVLVAKMDAMEQQ